MHPAVTLSELVSLFAGDWIHDDHRWDTTPCYSIQLALEIARRTDSVQETVLRQVIYGPAPCDSIPADALEAIRQAAARYRQSRREQAATTRNRGL